MSRNFRRLSRPLPVRYISHYLLCRRAGHGRVKSLVTAWRIALLTGIALALSGCAWLQPPPPEVIVIRPPAALVQVPPCPPVPDPETATQADVALWSAELWFCAEERGARLREIARWSGRSAARSTATIEE